MLVTPLIDIIWYPAIAFDMAYDNIILFPRLFIFSILFITSIHYFINILQLFMLKFFDDIWRRIFECY
jgi:hypothetical protein